MHLSLTNESNQSTHIKLYQKMYNNICTSTNNNAVAETSRSRIDTLLHKSGSSVVVVVVVVVVVCLLAVVDKTLSFLETVIIDFDNSSLSFLFLAAKNPPPLFV